MSTCPSPASSSGVSSASPPVPPASAPSHPDGAAVVPAGQDAVAEGPEVDIVINNVVCSFSVSCHLNLRDIALRGLNVEYRKENAMVTMKLRRPYTTASIWATGKITCTGANSEAQARIAARRFARILQKLEYKTRMRKYRVVNVLGTCTLPFAIGIAQFSQRHRERASYEPELHPAVTYKIKEPKATLKIFSTGSITITAPSVNHVQAAVEHIYPLVEEFKKPKKQKDLREPLPTGIKPVKRKKASASTSKKPSASAPKSKQRKTGNGFFNGGVDSDDDLVESDASLDSDSD